AGRDTQAARVVGSEREEREELTSAPVEDANLAGPTRSGRRNDLRIAVAVDVARRDARTAGEGRLEGEEMVETRAAVDAVDPVLREDPDLGLHPPPRRRHHHGATLAVEVGERDAHATLEEARVRAEGAQFRT